MTENLDLFALTVPKRNEEIRNGTGAPAKLFELYDHESFLLKIGKQ